MLVYPVFQIVKDKRNSFIISNICQERCVVIDIYESKNTILIIMHILSVVNFDGMYSGINCTYQAMGSNI